MKNPNSQKLFEEAFKLLDRADQLLLAARAMHEERAQREQAARNKAA